MTRRDWRIKKERGEGTWMASRCCCLGVGSVKVESEGYLMNCTRPFSRNYTEILRGALQLISMASTNFLIIHFLYSLCEPSHVPSQGMS